MRQYAGFGTAAETNARFRYLLEQGQTGLSVAFDLPTQMGYDADHPMARARSAGSASRSARLEDMADLLDGIPLDQVTTSMTINATAAILLALYVAVAERQGVPAAALGGTVQNDILKEYVARGHLHLPPGALHAAGDRRPSPSAGTDIPRWNTISISGYHIREAGSTAVQEVAFALANGVAYVEAARAAGLRVDEFAPQLSFFFNAHNDLLEEIAKYRAARRLWARLMRERFGARDPRAQMLRFHAQTAGSTLTAQQPENNVVRVTLQALAAILGGCQSLHTNSMDEALALPSEAAVRTALRTQQILAYESGVAETVDPLGGSYHVERLTDRDRGGGHRLPREDRRHGRRGGGDPLHAAGDPGRGLPGPAGGGEPDARRGGGQRVRHRGIFAGAPLPARSGGGRGPGRAPRPAARDP